jgi:hypothetical protein
MSGAVTMVQTAAASASVSDKLPFVGVVAHCFVTV